MKIDIPDILSRVQHGFALTNDEARWLLRKAGYEVPGRRVRCSVCGGYGEIHKRYEPPHWEPAVYACDVCHGTGYVAVPEPECEVVE